MKLRTLDQLAEFYKRSKATLRNWKNKGIPVIKDADGFYDTDRIDEALEALSPNKHSPSDPEQDNLSRRALTAAARTKEYQAEDWALRIERKKGLLVSLESVDRVLAKHINDAKLLLQTIPTTVGLVIANDPRKPIVEKEVESIIEAALRSLHRAASEGMEFVVAESKRSA